MSTRINTGGIRAVIAAAVLAVIAPPAFPCSTFFLSTDNAAIFGKNYDWHLDIGYLFVNKRGVVKRIGEGEDAARWTSRFGSVTFNQYGRELPSGGMNEAGLVVELMWLDDAEYPAPDRRAEVGSLQWIQYQLDMCATVADVVASDEVIRISREGSTALHYLVADRSGDCASIEFLDGRLVAHRGEDMPARALTNDTYAKSLAYLQGLDAGAPQGNGSLQRFARAAMMVADYDGAHRTSVDFGFDALADLAQGKYTQWSIVYDVSGERVHFRTREAARTRYVDLARIDFSCESDALMLDINVDLTGDVTGALQPYSSEQNYQLIRSAFRATSFLSDLPDDVLRRVAHYPEKTTCSEAPTTSDAMR